MEIGAWAAFKLLTEPPTGFSMANRLGWFCTNAATANAATPITFTTERHSKTAAILNLMALLRLAAGTAKQS
jgi:hypothetical protein